MYFNSTTVTEIHNHAFSTCFKLKKIEFKKNSQLQKICSDAFDHASIESISIPPHVTKLGSGIFYRSRIQIIEFDKNSEIPFIDQLSFTPFDVMIMIPVNSNWKNKKIIPYKEISYIDI